MNTKVIKVNPKAIDRRAVAKAAEILERGGLVAFPTETVYGIGANLLNRSAQERLKDLKNRPQEKQFSIHIADEQDVERYAVDVLARAYKMMEYFWPGPLTLVLKAPQDKSVGLRLPDNEIALTLLASVDFPVVAPSANFSGRPAPTDADAVLKELDGHIDLILDGGRTELGHNSTVLDARVLPFTVLREGVLKKTDVLKIAAKKRVLFICTGNSCRSVMAEYLLKKRLKDSGRQDVEVVSAGMLAFPGLAPTAETKNLIHNELGLDASGHRARKVDLKLLRTADLILVMERSHKENILNHYSAVKDRLHLFGDFAGVDVDEAEIPDPIGKDAGFYRVCFSKIQDGVNRMEI